MGGQGQHLSLTAIWSCPEPAHKPLPSLLSVNEGCAPCGPVVTGGGGAVIAISFVLGYSYLGLPCPQSNQKQIRQLQTHTADKAAEAKT